MVEEFESIEFEMYNVAPFSSDSYYDRYRTRSLLVREVYVIIAED